MIAIERNRPPRLVVHLSGTKFPESRSGKAVIVTLTDDEAKRLEPGDVIIWQDVGEVRKAPLRPLEVMRVRSGIAWEDGQQRPYEVPIVEGRVVGTDRVFAVPVPECLYWQVTTELHLDPHDLSAANFKRWSEHGGDAPKPVVDVSEYDQ